MNRRLEYFDFARFLAICGVIMIHTSEYSDTGFLLSKTIAQLGRFGVQLFFVISGATIFLSFSRDFNVGKFYTKRFFRIYPLFLVMGLIYSYKMNISLWTTLSPANAFNPANLNLIKGGWSIWNEMYFYLFVPIYFYIRNNNLKIIFFSLLILIVSSSINLRLVSLHGDPENILDFDYLNMFTQLSCFICGMEMMAGKFKKALYFCIPQFSISLLIKLYFYPNYLFFADYGANYWVVLIAIVAVLLLTSLKYIYGSYKITHFFILRLCQRLGKLTYTAYMIHFFVIEYLLYILQFDFGLELNFLIVTGTTFLISFLIHPYTETLPNSIAIRIVRWKNMPE